MRRMRTRTSTPCGSKSTISSATNSRSPGSYRLASSEDNASRPIQSVTTSGTPLRVWAFGLQRRKRPSRFTACTHRTCSQARAGSVALLGGWTFSGIMNYHSGFPYTPVFNAGTCDHHLRGRQLPERYSMDSCCRLSTLVGQSQQSCQRHLLGDRVASSRRVALPTS